MDAHRAESGVHLLSRITSLNHVTLPDLGKDIFPDCGLLESSKLIEIFGESNVGKSHLLYEMIARCILPRKCNGMGSEVIFINTDNDFNLIRMISICEKLLNPTMTSENLNIAVENNLEIQKKSIEIALKNLHIINCYSNEEFEIAINSLEDIVTENKRLAVLCVDSISAFYWLECKEQHYRRQISKLRKVATATGVVCIYTRSRWFATDEKMEKKLEPADYKFELIKLTHDDYSMFESKLDVDNMVYKRIFVIGCNGIKCLD